MSVDSPGYILFEAVVAVVVFFLSSKLKWNNFQVKESLPEAWNNIIRIKFNFKNFFVKLFTFNKKIISRQFYVLFAFNCFYDLKTWWSFFFQEKWDGILWYHEFKLKKTLMQLKRTATTWAILQKNELGRTFECIFQRKTEVETDGLFFADSSVLESSRWNSYWQHDFLRALESKSIGILFYFNSGFCAIKKIAKNAILNVLKIPVCVWSINSSNRIGTQPKIQLSRFE